MNPLSSIQSKPNPKLESGPTTLDAAPLDLLTCHHHGSAQPVCCCFVIFCALGANAIMVVTRRMMMVQALCEARVGRERERKEAKSEGDRLRRERAQLRAENEVRTAGALSLGMQWVCSVDRRHHRGAGGGARRSAELQR